VLTMVTWHTHFMARRKTTLYLDDELLQAAAERAARTGRAQRDVIEEALRRYLGLETAVRRIQARGDLDEEESLSLAYRELDAYRAERAKAM
jgi:predicted transcriptional regulator